MKYFDKNTWFWAFIAALFFLPFLGGVHLFDWDEINFAELAREIVVTGDWLQLQINYERFTEKPPLFFWFQAIAMSIFGISEFAARFPNALLGIIVLPFLYISGKFLVDRKFGYLWALSWFGSILPFLYFKSGIIDPLFNFFIFNGLFFLIHFLWKVNNIDRVFLSHKAHYYLIIGGVSVGLAILTKGPVAYLIIFLTVLVYAFLHSFRFGLSLKNFFIYSFAALLVFLLWFGIDASLHGPDFLIEFTIRQWELLTTNDAGHGGFPGYHFVVLLFGCFPASVFALRGLGRIKGIHTQIADFQKWMIILLVVILVLFSLVGTKIIHYSSMAYYPISFLAALSLWQMSEYPRKNPRWMLALLLFIGILVSLISALLPWAGLHLEEVKFLFEKDAFAMANLEAQVPWSWLDFIPAFLMISLLIVYTLYQQKHPIFSSRVLFFGTAAWTFASLIFFIGKVERISQRAAVEFFEAQQGKEVYVSTYGYKSYVPWFYARIEDYENPEATNREWLFHGDIDRDVLISTKVTKVEALQKEIPDAELMYTKNGFYFFRRPAQER
ncbi:MAG: glycosyl transferase [Bacteroidetes bacterium]|nr:MAG: glycosyl transferase [Bacteroidota bacterium]